MTATAKPKAKFSSRNLSAVYKAPRAKPAEVPNAFYPNAHRMLVLGKASVRGNMSASALAAKAHAVAVPTPINTPSLRKEHAGQDVHVHLVPSGRSGWANNGHGGDNGQHEEPQDDADNQTERPVAFPSSATTAKNVWGGGVSGEPAASLTSAPPQQNENQQEAEGISGLVSRGFGKMNSGRWGDDAVEQDIARSDMLRSMEKERQFPQLMHPSADARGDRSDSNANSSLHGPSGGLMRHHRLRSESYDDHHGQHGRHGSFDFGFQRGYSDDARFQHRSHSPAPAFDRFHSGSAYSYSDSNPENYYGGYLHSRYERNHYGSSSDQYRPYGLYRRGPHQDSTNVHPAHFEEQDRPRLGENNFASRERSTESSRDTLNAAYDGSLASEHEDGALPTKRAAESDVLSIDGGTLGTQEDTTKSPQCSNNDSDNTQKSGEPVEPIPCGNAWNNPPPFIPSASMWKHRPNDPPQHLSNPSGSEKNLTAVPSLTPATLNPVRILKRTGPKMLFDPKSGSMISVEEPKQDRRQNHALSTESRNRSSSTTEAKEKKVSHQNSASISIIASRSQELSSLSSTIVEPCLSNTIKTVKVDSPKPAPPVTSSHKRTSISKSSETKRVRVKTNELVKVKGKLRKVAFVYRPVRKDGETSRAPSSDLQTEESKVKSQPSPNQHISSSSTRERKRQVLSLTNASSTRKPRLANASSSGISSPPDASDRIPAVKRSYKDVLQSRVRPTMSTRNGVHVDELRKIPEGGGVVVITGAQTGIEFKPETSGYEFETVKSRKAMQLERRQEREQKQRSKRLVHRKWSNSGSTIVIAVPTSRHSKRTLSIGIQSKRAPAKLGTENATTSPEGETQHESKRRPAESSPTKRDRIADSTRSTMKNRSIQSRATESSSKVSYVNPVIRVTKVDNPKSSTTSNSSSEAQDSSPSRYVKKDERKDKSKSKVTRQLVKAKEIPSTTKTPGTFSVACESKASASIEIEQSKTVRQRGSQVTDRTKTTYPQLKRSSAAHVKNVKMVYVVKKPKETQTTPEPGQQTAEVREKPSAPRVRTEEQKNLIKGDVARTNSNAEKETSTLVTTRRRRPQRSAGSPHKSSFTKRRQPHALQVTQLTTAAPKPKTNSLKPAKTTHDRETDSTRVASKPMKRVYVVKAAQLSAA